MGQLRQIAARSEAEAFIASEFARAGRPLPLDTGIGFLESESSGHEPIDDDELDPYPPATKRAFWTGVVMAVAVVAMMWFGTW